MPLIRAVKAFFDRRLQTADPYGGRGPDYGTMAASGQAAAVLWLVAAAIAVPVVALLVVIGLAYEAVSRADRGRRVPDRVRWLMGVAIGVALLVAIAWWFVGR